MCDRAAVGGSGVTGAGGSTTQATSKVTGITLNAYTGRITFNNSALAAQALGLPLVGFEIDAGYAAYLDRQAIDAEALRTEEALRLPADLDYAAIGGLSNEVREKLGRIQPQTLGQAGRIEGMTPGALTALLAHVKRGARPSVAA